MNRRTFFGAASLAFAASPALPSQNMTLEELCNYHAEKLRDAMQALHGGNWDFHISHVTKQAFVRQISGGAVS